jgi:hypothetical protein
MADLVQIPKIEFYADEEQQTRQHAHRAREIAAGRLQGRPQIRLKAFQMALNQDGAIPGIRTPSFRGAAK